MRIGVRSAPRRGSIVPLLALCLTGLLAFIALAIDLGILMVARNQCQNAADVAAMVGARTLTGDASTNNNYSQVLPNATAALSGNLILTQSVDPSSQLTLTIGDYYYDTSSGSFKINPTGRQPGDNWTLVQAKVAFQRSSIFASLSGISMLNTSATATAAHRPRDVVIVIDFSSSMRFDSLLASPFYGARTQSMNPDSVYPSFGHYAGNSALLTYSGDVQAVSGEIEGAANDVVATQNGDPVVTGFYADTIAFGTTTPAFSPAPASYATSPGGDKPLTSNYNGNAAYATNVQDLLGGQTTRDWRFELDGYAAYAGGTSTGNPSIVNQDDYTNVPFNGYVQGPGYWGKTFFTWPPDPRIPLKTPFMTAASAQSQVQQFLADFGWTTAQINSAPLQTVWQSWPWSTASALQNYLTTPAGCNLAATDSRVHQIMRLHNRIGPGMPKDGSGNPVPCDWRARFFLMPDGVTPLLDNSLLYSNGTWNAPGSTTYLINYNAILDWIKNCGPNPFPNQLRAGGCVYYTAIPSTISTATFPPADPNQRFWKEYIDEMLGVQQTGGSGLTPTYQTVTPNTGFGDDFSWGTVSTTGIPSVTPPTYMGYSDNPYRPLLHFWFGPLSLIDYLDNYNMSRFWWPGTVRESPTYQTKLGVQAAIKDISINHPNDNVSLIFFSSPKSSASSTGYYNYARVPLSRDYPRMVNSLWFSPKVISTNAEINLYDVTGNWTGDFSDVPRANGTTCYAMPLMLAYNQFSTNSALVSFTKNAAAGTAGGLGRNGASRLLIFETDGMVNTSADAGFVTSSNGQGYYNVRIADANNWNDGGNEFPANVALAAFSTGATQSQTIAQQICNNLAQGGFSSPGKPVLIHCIAFGSLFNSTNTSINKTNALQNLATLEVIGSVQPSGATTLASNKIIVGDFNTRITNLQAAFRSIMQDGIQVVLIPSGPGLP